MDKSEVNFARILFGALIAHLAIACAPVPSDAYVAPSITTLATQEVLLPTITQEPYPAMTTEEGTISAKATEQAEMEMTFAAQSTNTPLPTFPADAPRCQAENLSVTASRDGAGGHIVFLARITNTSPHVCSLENPPDVKFVTEDGSLIEGIQYSTEPEYEVGIGIGIKDMVTVWVDWSNWCKPTLENAILRLTLPGDGGWFDLVQSGFSGARCDAPEAPSQLFVSAYFYP